VHTQRGKIVAVPQQIFAAAAAERKQQEVTTATPPVVLHQPRHTAGRARARSLVVGAVSQEGTFMSKQELSDMGVSIVGDPRGTSFKVRMGKAVSDQDKYTPAPSHELLEDKDPFSYDVDGVVKSPFNYNEALRFFEKNSVHSAAVESKAADASQSAMRIAPTEWATANIDQKTLEEARHEVDMFLKTLGEGRIIADMLYDVMLDFELMGSACFEVRRDRRGFIGAINHVPFSGVRVLRDDILRRYGVRYLQRRFNKRAYFAPFGSYTEYTCKDGSVLNPVLDEPEYFPEFATREQHVSLTGRFPRVDKLESTDDFGFAANEMVMLSRPPFTRSAIYGTPSGISAYSKMRSQVEIDNYNLAFFEGKGIPQYAVVFEGLTAPAGDEGVLAGGVTEEGEDVGMTANETAMLEEAIREYFTKQVTSGERNLLVVTLWGGATVRFEKLSADTKEASFELYEKRNTEAVRISHRIPGAVLGLYETANLGSGRDTLAIRRYLDHIVVPSQRMLASILETLIRCGTLIPYFSVTFDIPDIEERTEKFKFALDEFKGGGSTLDEYNEVLGRAPLPDNRGKYRILPMNVQIIQDDPVELQKSLHNAIAREQELRRMLSGDDDTSNILEEE